MKLQLKYLRLVCKKGIEIVEFAERLSFFHGEMSVGKSSIPALVDYCFGGRFPKTPALDSELVSVQLNVRLGDNDVLIERVPSDATYVQVSWQTAAGQRHHCVAPVRLQPNTPPILGDDVYTFSDLILRLLGVGVIKVKKRTYDPESSLVRLSIRDILEFVYLDQDHLDSDFFLLDVPVRKEKSQDAIRYFVGFTSERLNELQSELQELCQQQRVQREAAVQIKSFLGRFGFASEDRIAKELQDLGEEARHLQAELAQLRAGYRPDSHIADEERARLHELGQLIATNDEAIRDLEMRIGEQDRLQSELIALKFKAIRATVARAVLEGADFERCPACGAALAEHKEAALDHCYLCKTPADVQPRPEPSVADVVRQDLDARIDDLKQSISRHRKAMSRLRERAEHLRGEYRALEERVSATLRNYESDFLARTRSYEKRLSAIQERSALLERIRAMPAEIARIEQEADALSSQIDGLRRRIVEEEKSLVGAEENYKAIESNYKAILLAIEFPGVFEDDEVVINRRTLIPDILRGGSDKRTWNFFEAGSGGKKTLLKICFALALHKAAAEKGLPLPKLLMIDSPMKNITPDINPEVFQNFYTQLYKLLSDTLADWQVVLVDQTYAPPPESVSPFCHRLMKRDDPENPPLIRYYSGP
ncbi:MAG TPA: AAA family ATPase [Steroidobacter sp.]